MSREAWGDEDPNQGAFDAAIEAGWIDPTDQSKALIDVMNERDRQFNEEGWTHHHDDELTGFELARLAVMYAQHAGYSHKVRRDRERRGSTHPWFKPGDRRRDLVKAAALILAEIERLDRVAQKS